MSLRSDLEQPHLGMPDKVFLVDLETGRTTTYRQFALAVGGLSERLRRAGVGPGTRISALLPNCPEYAVLYFACMETGAVIVPINPIFSRDECQQILTLGEATCLVHDSSLSHLADALDAASLVRILVEPGQLEEWAQESPDGLELWEELECDRLFLIAFSSGTTSEPKGVCHSAGNLLHAAKAFNKHTCASSDDRYYHVLSMSYMAGFLNMLLCPYLVGATIALDQAFTARTAMRFWKAPVEHELNTMWLVPTMLSALLHANRDEKGADYARRNVRHAFVGTAPLPPSLQREFQERYGFELLESYGMTEVLFVSANRPRQNRPGSAGSLLPGVEVRSDEHTEELFVRAAHSMQGYLGGATAPVWFPTGDLGGLDVDGNLRITGRKKDLIIRGGINVSPRRVEDLLLEHPGIVAAAVVGVPHRFYGEEVVAVLELDDGFDLETIRPELERRADTLSAPSRPTRYLVRDTLPRSSTGKVRKAQLRKEIDS